MVGGSDRQCSAICVLVARMGSLMLSIKARGSFLVHINEFLYTYSPFVSTTTFIRCDSFATGVSRLILGKTSYIAKPLYIPRLQFPVRLRWACVDLTSVYEFCPSGTDHGRWPEGSCLASRTLYTAPDASSSPSICSTACPACLASARSTKQ